MREIRAPNALLVVKTSTIKGFLDLLQVEDERDIYAQGIRVVEVPDDATAAEVERIVAALE